MSNIISSSKSALEMKKVKQDEEIEGNEKGGIGGGCFRL